MSKITVTNKKLPGSKVEAILYTEEQWDKIKDYIGQTERKVKEIAEELKLKEERKKCSEEMAKKWDNTYANLRKKRFEDRRARLEREKNRKYERFLRLQREEKQLKEEVRKKARDILYEEKDDIKCALSSYKFAETLRERERQKEFNRKIREVEEKREEEYTKKIFDDLEIFHKEEEKKKTELFEKRLKLKKEFKEMLENIEEQKRKENEAKKAEEREDMKLIINEIKEIEKNEQKEKERRKNIIRKELLENRKLIHEQEKVRKAEEKEENEALAIISNGKIRLAKKRFEKETQMKAEAIKRREKIAARVTAAQLSRDDIEEVIYQKAKAKIESLEIKRLEDEKNHILKLKQERINDRLEFLKNEELNKQKNHELMKWAILQRFKSEDVSKQFRNLNAEKRLKKTMEILNENKAQAEIDNAKRKEEIEMDILAVRKAEEMWREDDEHFFKFVEELKKESIEVGRPVFPLENAICEYKKRYGLLEIPRQPRIFKSNIPIDDDKPKIHERKGLTRINYTKPGPSKNPQAFEVKRTPITYVKNIKHANGLQDQK